MEKEDLYKITKIKLTKDGCHSKWNLKGNIDEFTRDLHTNQGLVGVFIFLHLFSKFQNEHCFKYYGAF